MRKNLGYCIVIVLVVFTVGSQFNELWANGYRPRTRHE